MNGASDALPLMNALGLTQNEAAVFMCLIEGPKTPVEVSRLTGIARSNVYRIADGLIDKGMLRSMTTEEGRMLISAEPEALEVLVIEHEERARAHRENFARLLPLLQNVAAHREDFAINTYTGLSGLKQMLWNELKMSREVLVFSSGTLDLATGHRWAEKYRSEVIERGIVQRSLENNRPGRMTKSDLSEYTGTHYIRRYLPADMLDIQMELAIHEDTIFIYNPWDHEVKLGTEIKNAFLATFMRQVFEHYWALATEPER